MKKRQPVAVVLVGWLTLTSVGIATPQGESTPAAAPDVPAPSAKPAQNFAPGLDDLMTLLIQPRHVKLYYAGKQKNWELAAAQLSNLRSAFNRVSQTIPRYQGSDVEEAIKATIAPKMQAMDGAITAADSKQFDTAYSDLTAACNACHFYLEHAFLVIKVPQLPAAAAYPDQRFSVSPN
jgi:hypothetical protein